MKKVFLTLIFALVVFSFAACGVREVKTPGVTDTTILVGNAAATSGPFSAVGIPFNHAIQKYFERVNENGGINGRTIEWVHYDDEFNPELGSSFIQQLVEEDEVFALVGHFGTPTVGATHEYLNTIGIPRVYYATGVRVLFNTDATGGERASFPVQPIFDAEGEVMVARAVAEYGVEKIGVLYTNDDAGLGILAGVELRAAILGIEVESREVDPGELDYSAAANVLVNDESIDAIIAAANQEPAKIMIQALYTAGNTLPVFTSYVSADATFIADISEQVASEQFNLYANAWIDIMDPEGQMGFSDAYWDFATTVDAEWAANAFAMAGWIAAHFFVEGLKRVGEAELTWDSFIAAMESEPVEIPFGGIVDFANGRRVGTQAMALLKATVGVDEEENPVYEWINIREIDDIESILGE
ncbi:MAG: hypothetical protein EA374_06805 [Acholeplasmatales bacterium]|nr:MAG: hypothetical protein EA374_06805 [Acholeplasmatales bacterium]